MKKDTDMTLISTAASNAAAAANSASQAASKAADNAAIAAKAAAESATAIAVVATDTSWMKKSLEGIEITLNEMNKAFVTSIQHQEVINELSDHEERVRLLERNIQLWAGGLTILVFLIPLLLKFFFKNW